MARAFSYPAVDLTNATAVAVWYETHDIPQRYNPAIVVASVLVAILGSYSTLIVLGRRTSNSGFRNAALLVWAAMTMSCVGIWGMHFIGMNFKLQPLPGQGWYISFSPAFTVFSLIVPFIALVLAFIFVDYFTLTMWRIVASGVLTGCIVGLMHYSASMKCNFQVSYRPAQTVVSIILACACAIIALTLFFRLRAQWQDSWQRRFLCSIILAVGVSGMHYLGSSGTNYRMRPENVNNLNKLTHGKHGNTTVVIVVAVMAFVITVASAVMSISDMLSQRETRKKARKIVLASASFDHLGRLMVKADGSLPMVTLEESNLRHSEVLDALDARNEIFQWLYSVSWAWQVVAPFLDAIAHRVGQPCGSDSCTKEGGKGKDKTAASAACPVRSRFARIFGLNELNARRAERKRVNAEKAAQATSHNASGVGSKSLALLDFRDRVVDAARRLADDVEVPMDKVGVFYDHVLPTGTQKSQRTVQALKQKPATLLRWDRRGGAAAAAAAKAAALNRIDGYADDEEASISTSRAASIFNDGEDDEEGVSMFLVREIPVADQTSLAKKGYRFTETRFLATVLADRHGVSKVRMDELLDGLRVYAKRGTKPVVQPGGVYAGLFGVRPSTSARQGGLDVLVYNFARHQIPAFRLPDVAAVTPEMRTFLRLLDQMPIDQALRVCERESVRTAERNKAIAKILLDQAHAQMLNDSQSAAEASGRLFNGASVVNVHDTAKTSKNEESLRQVLDLQNQEASLQAFQIALYTALEALMQSVRVFPRLNSTARISADILEVPSSLDDSTPPAHVILVQAVLPADKGPHLRSSASMLGGLMSSNHPNGGAGNEAVEAAAAPPTLVVPTETPQSGTPFVFTPYTLFTRTQTMLLRGRTASSFSAEVQQALSLRFNVFPGDQSYASTTEKEARRYSRSDMSQSLYSPGDMSKSLFDNSKEGDVGSANGDDEHDEDARAAKTGALKWLSQLKASTTRGSVSAGKHGAQQDRRLSKPDTVVDLTHDDVIIQLDSASGPSSPLTGHQHLPMSHSSSNGGGGVPNSQSLGIRRFTQAADTMGENNVFGSPPAVIVDQSRFARPASEYDESGYVYVAGSGERRQSARSASTTMTRSTSSRARSGGLGQAPGTTVVGPATPRRRSSAAVTDASSSAGGHTQQALPLPPPPAAASSLSNHRSRSRTAETAFGGGAAVTISDAGQSSRRPSTAAIPEHAAYGSPSAQRPTSMRRQSTARSTAALTSNVGLVDSTTQDHPTLRVHPPLLSTAASPDDHADLGTQSVDLNAESLHARSRVDNWQMRQLRDLERFQPNLLLGVLPSEY